MGYETNLIFISNSTAKGKKYTGYCHVEASLQMGKVCYGEIQTLLNTAKLPDEKHDEMTKEIEKRESEYREVFNREGNYTEEMLELTEAKREKTVHNMFAKTKKLGNKLPYIFWANQNMESFCDDYGSVLLIVDLEDIQKAIIIEQARYLKEQDWIYRRFGIALSMIEHFQKEEWKHENIKVVLWGH